MLLSPLAHALNDLFEQFHGVDDGTVATYIPELGRADPHAFGIAIVTVDGHAFTVGDAQREFTIQSISKPFVYGLALDDVGLEVVASRVGVEPSGEAFNAISLEPGTGRPRNPMINAGAIATTSLISGESAEERFGRMLAMFGRYAGRDLDVDERVYHSERETGHRNRAIGHLLRNAGVLEGEVDPVVDRYFRQCSVLVNCLDLATMAAALAKGGRNPITQEVAVGPTNVPRILSVMSSCGMYDYSGSWVFDVGIPAKSGVAGGVMAVLPGQFGLGVYSPPLDDFGNSVRGVGVCEALSREFNLHLLQPPVNVSAVVRASYTLAHVTSKRRRQPMEMLFIAEHGGSVRAIELQGPLALSTVAVALEEARGEVGHGRTIVLDFRRVQSIDAAAFNLLGRFAAGAAAAGTSVVFAALRESDRAAFAPLVPAESGQFAFRSSIDAALEWCEDRLLHRLRASLPLEAELPLRHHPLLGRLSAEELDAIGSVAEREEYPAGATVIRQGNTSDSFYLVAAGVAAVELELPNGSRHRLATLGSGTTFGEHALIDAEPRSATVLADTLLTCYRVSVVSLAELDRVHPGLRLHLIESFAHDLAARLRRANDEISVLAS